MRKDFKRKIYESLQKPEIFNIEFGIFLSCYDRVEYLKYKDLDEKDIPYEHKDTIRILKILEDMGFPMDKAGTYLYKILIENIMKQYSNVSLEDLLNNPYSQFYFDIARNDLDIGVKTFHTLIMSAIKDIDKDKLILMSDILDERGLNIDYEELAYLIAKYVVEDKNPDKSSEIISFSLSLV